MREIVETLEKQLQETKRAYHRALPGVTYEDMQSAARRLLLMRSMLESSLGKKPISDPKDQKQIARLLR